MLAKPRQSEHNCFKKRKGNHILWTQWLDRCDASFIHDRAQPSDEPSHPFPRRYNESTQSKCYYLGCNIQSNRVSAYTMRLDSVLIDQTHIPHFWSDSNLIENFCGARMENVALQASIKKKRSN